MTRLEVAHHHRIGVRAGDGADAVVGVVDIRDPVAQALVHRVLQRGGAGGDGHHLRAQQLHAEDVGLLALDVGGTHEHGAGQVHQGAGRGGGDAMLAGAGLGDDARLAHALGQQDLAQHGVDLVRAGVVQLVALDVYFRAVAAARRQRSEVLRQALGVPQRRGPPDIMRQQPSPLRHEGRVALRLVIGALDLQDQRHQRLGHETAAELAEAAAGIGALAEGVGQGLVQGGVSGVPGKGVV
jgi:hypothetical protein